MSLRKCLDRQLAASGLYAMVWRGVLSFLLSACCSPGWEAARMAAPPRQEGGDWRLGWRRVRSSPTLRVLLSADALSSLEEGRSNVLGVIFVVEVRHAGATGRGVIGSAQALGGRLGGLLVGHLGTRWKAKCPIGLGLVGNEACLLALFVLQNSPAALARSALCGLLVLAAGMRLLAP